MPYVSSAVATCAASQFSNADSQRTSSVAGSVPHRAALSGKRVTFTSSLQRLAGVALSLHDMTVTVTQCGRLSFGRRKVNLSQIFAGQSVGVREVTDHIWLISFMHYDLGFFDDQCTRVECAPNPFSAKVSASPRYKPSAM